MSDYVRCSNCGKQVSNVAEEELIVRAYVKCPECIECESGLIDKRELTQEEKDYANTIDLKAIADEYLNRQNAELCAENARLKNNAERYEDRLHTQKEIVIQGIERERKLVEEKRELIEDAERLAQSVLDYWVEYGCGERPDSWVEHNELMARVKG